MHIHVQIRMGIWAYNMYKGMHARIYTHGHMHIRTYIHVCIYIYIYIYIYERAYLYIHTYTNTFMHTYHIEKLKTHQKYTLHIKCVLKKEVGRTYVHHTFKIVLNYICYSYNSFE